MCLLSGHKIHSLVEDRTAEPSAVAGSYLQLEGFAGRTVAFLEVDKLGLEGSSAYQTVAAEGIQALTAAVEDSLALTVVGKKACRTVAAVEIQALAAAEGSLASVVAGKKAYRTAVAEDNRGSADSSQIQGSAGSQAYLDWAGSLDSVESIIKFTLQHSADNLAFRHFVTLNFRQLTLGYIANTRLSQIMGFLA